MSSLPLLLLLLLLLLTGSVSIANGFSALLATSASRPVVFGFLTESSDQSSCTLVPLLNFSSSLVCLLAGGKRDGETDLRSVLESGH
jgi:hypothetical protein